MENATDVLRQLLLSEEWNMSKSMCLSLSGIAGCADILLSHAQIKEARNMSHSTPEWINSELKPRGLTANVGSSDLVQMTDMSFEVQECKNLRFGIGNKVHFKGRWKTSFDELKTSHCVFRTSPPGFQGWILVQVMIRVEDNDTSTLVTEDLQHFRVLHLPYCGDDAYMHILIPQVGEDSDVFELLKRVPDLTHYFDLKGAKRAASYTLLLPKWQTESEQPLTKTMELLNVPLGGLSWITQTCVVEVQEKGLLFMDKKKGFHSGPSRKCLKYIVDQPFIYVITTSRTDGEKGRIMLFLGAVKDPRPNP